MRCVGCRIVGLAVVPALHSSTYISPKREMNGPSKSTTPLFTIQAAVSPSSSVPLGTVAMKLVAWVVVRLLNVSLARTTESRSRHSTMLSVSPGLAKKLLRYAVSPGYHAHQTAFE